MTRECEVGSITDGKRHLRCGLDADSRHAGSKTSEAGKSSSMPSTWLVIVSRWAFSALMLAVSENTLQAGVDLGEHAA